MQQLFWVNTIHRPEYGLTSKIICACIDLQRIFGPGLLERAYEELLAAELMEQGLVVRRQVIFPLIHRSVRITKAYKTDLIVNEKVLVELKAIRTLTDADTAQTLTYLKLSGLEVALLINFNAVPLKTGIKRFIRTHPAPPA